MKVKQIVKDVPLHELLATIELQTEIQGATLPAHITNVVQLAQANPNIEVSDDVANFFKDWLTHQHEIQQLAAAALTRLEQEAPLPTPEALINGNPVWPEWVNKWWANVLRIPWAGRLGEAVAEAMIWLDERQSQKSTSS